MAAWRVIGPELVSKRRLCRGSIARTVPVMELLLEMKDWVVPTRISRVCQRETAASALRPRAEKMDETMRLATQDRSTSAPSS